MASDPGKRIMILSELVMNLQCERMPLRLLREVMKMKRLTASILTTVFLTVMYLASVEAAEVLQRVQWVDGEDIELIRKINLQLQRNGLQV